MLNRYRARFTQSGMRRLAANGSVLATTVVRDASAVFGGLGVYSVSEVFFLAGEFTLVELLLFNSLMFLPGLSVFLTEEEIFTCPSRVARLCEAFWTFARRRHVDLPYVHSFRVLWTS